MTASRGTAPPGGKINFPESETAFTGSHGKPAIPPRDPACAALSASGHCSGCGQTGTINPDVVKRNFYGNADYRIPAPDAACIVLDNPATRSRTVSDEINMPVRLPANQR